MQARHRSAIYLGALVLVLFILHWRLDDYTCDPARWHSKTLYDHRFHKSLLSWRQPPAKEQDQNTMGLVFAGGKGTPAIFAMLGGQRYLVANILWNYSDVLFHQGKKEDMVGALGATVSLNPKFTEAWSVLGWHLAWNLNADTNDVALKEKRLHDGIDVYKAAIEENPEKPKHYFDLSWLYIQRIGDYKNALPWLEYVVNDPDKRGFAPMTIDDKMSARSKGDIKVILEQTWEPQVIGHRLAYVHKMLGIINNDWTEIRKAIDVYQLCKKIDPKDSAADTNINMLSAKLTNKDEVWMKKMQDEEKIKRERYGMSEENFSSTSNPNSEFYKGSKR